jgi:septal ring factor EnvC (AmiA/AmiB activator)
MVVEPFEEQKPCEHEHQNEREIFTEQSGLPRWLATALIALLAIAGVSLAYGLHQRNMVNQLQSQAAATNSSMTQLQTQVATLTAKLNDLNAPQHNEALTPAAPAPSIDDSSDVSAPAVNTSPVAPAPIASSSKPRAPAKHAATKRRGTTDKRYAQLKAQLDDQQKQLKETQDQVSKNRADLEGSISSTRDELNGSIAKTHDELVALERRGERSYFEFDLSKSKRYQRVGPLTLSLRKADTKHKNYDLAMIVDDSELNKKKVNLYEPIWIHTENGGQPLQVVVNRIDKNLVHGYVSAPKYKQSELAALSSSGAPASGNGGSAQQQPAPQQ